MPATTTIDVLRVEAQRTTDLFDAIISLRDHLKHDPNAKPFHKITDLYNQAHQIASTLALVRASYAPNAPFPPRKKRDCPDQLPLFENAPTASD